MNNEVYIIVLLCFVLLPITSCYAEGENLSEQAEFLSDHLERVISFSQGWGELGIDVSAHAPWQIPLPLQIKDKKYEKGLGHHANGEIVIALDGEYLAFETEIGVQWQGGQNVASVVFQIFVDGEKRFDSGIIGELAPPRVVRVPLKGAKELRLVVKDAGDGIICDCANWANARLIPDPSAKRERRERKVNIATFARVVFSDPERAEGCRGSRIEEFLPEDIFLEKEIAPSSKGYIPPKVGDGKSCIGLVWFERRRLTTLQLEFTEESHIPEPEEIQVQCWQGESHWQGSWVPLLADVKSEGNRLTFAINWQSQAQLALYGTEKVRWIFPPTSKSIFIKNISAFTNSIWDEGEILLELEKPLRDGKGTVEIYNGEILEDGKAVYRKEWDLGDKLHLKLRYSRPTPCKGDRTILRIELPDFSFAIAVEDILGREGVYVGEFGVFASTYPPKINLAEYKEKTRGKKTVLERVREMPDQTFSQAMAKVHKTVQDNGPTMLSLACDNHKFVVPREGGVRYGSFEVKAKFASGKNTNLRRFLDGGWFPIPVTAVEENYIIYRQRSFVVPFDEEDKASKNPPYWLNRKPLFVAVIEAFNKGTGLEKGEINLIFWADGEKGIPAKLEKTTGGILISYEERILAFVEIGEGENIKDNQLEIVWNLPKGRISRAVLYIPGWEMEKEEVKGLCLGEQVNLLLAKTKRYWESVLSSATKIDIPEELLANVIRASQVHCLIAARNEEEGKRVAPWIASMSYGPLESEAHSIIYGMSLFGHREFARRGLEFFISRYNEKGYLTTGYTLVGTGWHLWTLARYYKLFKDGEWLKSVASQVANLCDWLIRQREKTKELDISGERMPEWGLMPPGVAADWNRFAYRFFNQAHYYAGLAEMGEVLKDIDYPEAERFLKDAEEFKGDIMRAYRWNQARMPVLELSNGNWVPAYPGILYCFGKVGDMYPGEDGNRSWAGDVEIGAHYLIPCGVLEANSKDAEWIVEHMEDYWFLYSGMGEYPEEENRKDWFNLGGFSKLQPYYTRIVEIYAQQDEVKPFIRSYFNAIPSLLNTENLSFWEHFHNMGAWNKTHETGWFLVQTRNMFLVERGRELWLAPFVPRYWLEDGKKVAVLNAPSYFGNVSYKIHSSLSKGYIEAEIEFTVGNLPDRFVLRIRHPRAKRIKRVIIDGNEHKDFDLKRECIYIPPKRGRITLRVYF